MSLYLFALLLLILTVIAALGGSLRIKENFYNEVFDIEEKNEKEPEAKEPEAKDGAEPEGLDLNAIDLAPVEASENQSAAEPEPEPEPAAEVAPEPAAETAQVGSEPEGIDSSAITQEFINSEPEPPQVLYTKSKDDATTCDQKPLVEEEMIELDVIAFENDDNFAKF